VIGTKLKMESKSVSRREVLSVAILSKCSSNSNAR
jgi:hypothetical protein